MNNKTKCVITCMLALLGARAWAKSYTREFADDSLSLASGYTGGTISGKTMTTGDGSDLVYVAGGSNDNLNRNTYGWYAGAKIQWPGDEEISAAKAKHVLSFPAQTIYADDFTAGCALTYGNTYMDTTTWWTWITPEQAYAAVQGGEENITRTLTINGEKTTWAWNNYTVNASTFTVTFPLTGLTLKDSSGVQWYPAVALIGEKVYGDLNVAIKTRGTVNCVADGTITEAIVVDENSTLVLNNGGHTITGLDNLTLKGGTFNFNPATAGCTVATGYEITDNGNNTWTVIRGHEHTWAFTVNGAKLTAKCANMASDCDVPARMTSITLTVTGGTDGVAPTFAIENEDTFLAYVNKDGEVASIGDITVVRTTDDGAETTKWYIGNYTATCVMRANGEEKTMRQDFSISGEYKAGGYAVASRSVRYNSFDEAIAAAAEDDTIHYRDGEITDQSISFAVTKNVTLDFGGTAFYYKGNSDANFWNTGVGKLTLKNIELKQPRYSPTVGSRKYHNITFYGAFAFGEGVKGITTDGDCDDLLTINAVNGSIEVLENGLYQCAFAAGDGGSVSITGGEFWSRQRPNEAYIPNGHVIVDATTADYAYMVVPHAHDFYYETNGNVITLKCKGAGYAGCAWTLNENKLTLTATNACEGVAYAGASYTYDDSFLFDGEAPEIEYYKNNVKIPAPSTYGNYEARVTVTYNGSVAMAVQAFTVIHNHIFVYNKDDATGTITARCTRKTDCDFNVNPRTAQLHATDATYTGYALDPAAYDCADDFPTNLVKTYAPSAPQNVGTYTVTLAAGETTVTTNFTVAKASMANVSAGLNATAYDYADAEIENALKSAMLGTYGLTADDYDLSGLTVAKGSGYSNCTYTVTLTGKGNFEGTQELSWTIKAPELSFDDNPLTAAKLAETAMEYATCAGTVMTLTDSTHMPYNNGWFVGFSVAYPYSVQTWAPDSQVTDLAHLRFRTSTSNLPEDTYYTGTDIQAGKSTLTAVTTDSHTWAAQAGDVTYAKTLLWWAPVTPAMIEQAAMEKKTEAIVTATIGGLLWRASGSIATTTFKGVKFTDFKIALPLENFVFALPTNGTQNIGNTVLVASKIRLAAGASVTTTIAQGEGQIYTEEIGYHVGISMQEGVYTYTCTTEPQIIPPTGDDPVPTIEPVEGTNGVYVVEVKTNTTTAVQISGLGSSDTVIAPPQIDTITGTEANPIATNQVRIVADATNGMTTVKVDITPAFTITENGDGVSIALNATAIVTVEIAGKEPEEIAVLPELGTAMGTPVADTPFVVTDDAVAVGVKTIPGLSYNLLEGDTVTDITTRVKTIVAEDTRIVLEAAKRENPKKFYKIQVAK